MFAKLKTNPQTPQESNPITQYFEIGKQVASAGPELVWKIHEAVRKSDKRLRSSKKGICSISRENAGSFRDVFGFKKFPFSSIKPRDFKFGQHVNSVE
ncbi:uncharacterized protein TNCV_1198481 [Trichonephila clavipes]|uniref:Uncharacterized protein n=1 Tax=Trichonephila clavipes TaxID=2585209 RepID=A0A8X6VFE7_TRICX|nr:uncharacterized protein TNCV_1198481 [Trichonephila clavipes]